MTFDKGSLILIDYTARTKNANKVFETTLEEVAKTHEIYSPDTAYSPMLVSIGDAWTLEGVDEALIDTDVGDEFAVEIPPEKGFGLSDPKKIKTLPLRKLGDNANKVTVGDTVDVDNRSGVIKMIGSGRVKIDFNHRYSGKTLVYSIKVKKLLDTDDEKIVNLIKRNMNINDDEMDFVNEGDAISITIPKSWMRKQDLHTIKHLIQADIFKFLPHLNKISFIDKYYNTTKGTSGDAESEL